MRLLQVREKMLGTIAVNMKYYEFNYADKLEQKIF